MRARKLLMVTLVVVCVLQAEKPDTLVNPRLSLESPSAADDKNNSLILDYAAGSGILGFEFVGIPVLSRYLNWKRPVKWENPLKFINELEPYLQDETWHFAGAHMTTEFNYHVLSHYFGREDPLVAAGVLSLAFWTGMECLDGLAGSGFSLRDQAANSLGAAFGMLKLRYPDIPVHFRLGVENWGRFLMFARSGFNRNKTGTDFYSIFKTELIYVFENDLYAGIALSKGRGKKNHTNRFGISAGYDLLNDIGENKDSHLCQFIDFLRRHLVLSIGVTYWPDQLEFEY
ncbi:MAG: hypothetical protein ACLFQB_08665 [Chitinispirillaceae bacterium]